ncbi:MAG: formylglycine-generating enzyme family protein [Nitrospiraceae bacterium]
MSQSARDCSVQGPALPDKGFALFVAILLVVTVLSAGTVTAQSIGKVVGTVTSAAEKPNDISPAVLVGESDVPRMPKEITSSDDAPMVLIPAAEFVMGSPDGEGEKDEHPQHRVRIAAFYMDKYEVTVARYHQFLEATGHVRPDYWPREELKKYHERPVIGVDWNGARAYCEWAEKRLPTEAEWEYAARGKDGRRYPWGNTAPTPELANYGKVWTHNFYKDRLAPVGSHEGGKSPFGLHDMAGNVWEWVADWYDAKYYARSPEDNPPGPSSGSVKVLRGGSWSFVAAYMRAAGRLRFPPRHRDADIGLRCARDAGQQG